MSDNETHNADPTSNSPGAILRRCREYHAISLDEAAEATKIAAHYLQALEDDQIKEFANLAYLKGFLRIYATHLGLNPDDMIRLYERQYESAGTIKSGRADSSGTTRSGEPRRFPIKRLTLPAVLLLLLIITSMVLNRSQDVPKQPAVLQQNPSVAPLQAVQKVQSSVRQTAPVTQKAESAPAKSAKSITDEAASEQNGPQNSPAESGKGFVVRLKVTQNGTLNVTIDGATAQGYDLTSGDIIEWKAEKTIGLDLSNAGSVSAELSGKPLKPFGPAGTPVYIVLDANGIRQ